MGEKLGQHYLKDESVVADMIDAAAVISEDTVVEIGPGKGILTKALLNTGAGVIAVEKDLSLIEHLKKAFSTAIHNKQLRLIEEDIRDIDPSEVVPDEYKLVANIPYYITAQILRQFLTANTQPDSIAILVQKEVGQRITNDSKEGILSLSVKAYGHPTLVRSIPKEAFSPQPDVDSAILHIDDISREFFEDNDIAEKDFFKLIKAGFAHKRKTLANNLASAAWHKQEVEAALVAVGLDKKTRAETLSLHAWREIYTHLQL